MVALSDWSADMDKLLTQGWIQKGPDSPFLLATNHLLGLAIKLFWWCVHWLTYPSQAPLSTQPAKGGEWQVWQGGSFLGMHPCVPIVSGITQMHACCLHVACSSTVGLLLWCAACKSTVGCTAGNCPRLQDSNDEMCCRNRNKVHKGSQEKGVAILIMLPYGYGPNIVPGPYSRRHNYVAYCTQIILQVWQSCLQTKLPKQQI